MKQTPKKPAKGHPNPSLSPSKSRPPFNVDDASTYCLAADRVLRSALDNNLPLAQHFVDSIFGEGTFVVESYNLQEGGYQHPNGKFFFFDFLATDQLGRYINIEVQLSHGETIPKRIRENQAHIDNNQLATGMMATDLKDIYIVFISYKDILGLGLPKYTSKIVIEESPEHPFSNLGVHYIIVNAEQADPSTPLGQFVLDLFSLNEDNMYDKKMAKALKKTKTPFGIQEVKSKMGNFWDDVRADASDMRAKEIVDSLIRRGILTDEQISADTNTDLGFVTARRHEIEAEKKEAADKEAEEQRTKDEMKKVGLDQKSREVVDALLSKGKFSDQEIAEVVGVDIDFVLSRRKAIQ